MDKQGTLSVGEGKYIRFLIQYLHQGKWLISLIYPGERLYVYSGTRAFVVGILRILCTATQERG